MAETDSCPCASLDWAGHDLTAKHHTDCPTESSERLLDAAIKMAEAVNTLYVKDDPFMTPRAGAVVELTYHSPHGDENGLKNLQTIKEVAEAQGAMVINGVRCIILGYVERLDADGITLKLAAKNPGEIAVM
jgi:hypothetical protein